MIREVDDSAKNLSKNSKGLDLVEVGKKGKRAATSRP